MFLMIVIMLKVQQFTPNLVYALLIAVRTLKLHFLSSVCAISRNSQAHVFGIILKQATAADLQSKLFLHCRAPCG